MDLNLDEAVEQLRTVARVRFDAYLELRDREDEVSDATLYLSDVDAVLVEAQEIARAFREKWEPRRDEIRLEIADINTVLSEVYRDLRKYRNFEQVAYRSGRRRDAFGHHAKVEDYAAEALELEQEKAEYQSLLELTGSTLRQIDQGLSEIQDSRHVADVRLRAAKETLDEHIALIQEIEIQYVHADSQLSEIERAIQKRRNAFRRAVLKKADVPEAFRHEVKVNGKSDGTWHVYFGGINAPDGDYHGHYVIDRTGRKAYARDPFTPHGPHNYLIQRQKEGNDPTQS